VSDRIPPWAAWPGVPFSPEASNVRPDLGDDCGYGDLVHAAIPGLAEGNDDAGRSRFTAPSEAGQARAVAGVLAMSGIGPRVKPHPVSGPCTLIEYESHFL
jgi:hypothetical protein